MMRSTVDLPQPEGPTIVTSSPMSGASSTTKETSWIATLASAPCPKLLVTFLNTTTSGRAGGVFGAPAAAAGAPAGWTGVPLALAPGLAAPLIVICACDKEIAV